MTDRINFTLETLLKARVERLEGTTEDHFAMVSKSQAMSHVNESLTALRRESVNGAPEHNLLIVGERGTAKDGLARMVHLGSRRKNGPWISEHCAFLANQPYEKIFGKPGFPGLVHLADQGTLHLENIHELELPLQRQIAHVAKTGKFRRPGDEEETTVDVRFMVSIPDTPELLVQRSKLSPDLLSAVNQVRIDLPPLRLRKDDIIALATRFGREIFGSLGGHFESFSPSAEKELTSYAWPGNTRELYAVIQRSFYLCDGSGSIGINELRLSINSGASSTTNLVQQPASNVHILRAPREAFDITPTEDQNFTNLKKKWSDAFERDYLVKSLTRNKGNVSAAAREAKLDRSNFLRLLRRHGIKAQTYREKAVVRTISGEEKAA